MRDTGRIRRLIGEAASPVAVLFAWEALARSGLVSAYLLPPASQVALRLASPVPRLPLRGDLAPGDYRWRVSARDGRGLGGPPSEPRRLRVVEKPPRLEVESPVWR